MKSKWCFALGALMGLALCAPVEAQTLSVKEDFNSCVFPTGWVGDPGWSVVNDPALGSCVVQFDADGYSSGTLYLPVYPLGTAGLQFNWEAAWNLPMGYTATWYLSVTGLAGSWVPLVSGATMSGASWNTCLTKQVDSFQSFEGGRPSPRVNGKPIYLKVEVIGATLADKGMSPSACVVQPSPAYGIWIDSFDAWYRPAPTTITETQPFNQVCDCYAADVTDPNQTGYRWKRNGAVVGTSAVPYFRDTNGGLGLTNSTVYNYTVETKDRGNQYSTTSAVVTCTPVAGPPAPVRDLRVIGLGAAPDGTRNCDLYFTTGLPGGATYRVYKSASPDLGWWNVSGDISTSPYHDGGGLGDPTTYYYSIRSVVGGVESID